MRGALTPIVMSAFTLFACVAEEDRGPPPVNPSAPKDEAIEASEGRARPSEGAPPTAKAPETSNAPVLAEQLDGVWVFFWPDSALHIPSGGAGSDQARLQGPAKVEGDCLRVGESVVVWRSEKRQALTDAIGRVQKGEAVELMGGGSSLPGSSGSGDDPEEAVLETPLQQLIRSIIEGKCGATEIFATRRQ